MNDAQKKALKRIGPVLNGILQMNANSYTNLIGPAIGRIDDTDILRECRAIEAFCKAFGVEYTSITDLCAEQIRDFSRQMNRA
jgi:hypothetical protein